MRTTFKMTVAAATIAGAAMLSAAPAQADGFSIGIGSGGIGFSYDSGGYCDSYGCPDSFWDYPVYYCPVYFRGDWYRGPVYYRRYDGRVQFWILGNWRYDQWRGPRPEWACIDHFGPPLGFDYYENHGFRMRDSWRNEWRRDYNRDHGAWRGNTHDYGNWNDRGSSNWNGGDNRGQQGGFPFPGLFPNGGDNRGGDRHDNNRGNDGRGNDHRDNGNQNQRGQQNNPFGGNNFLNQGGNNQNQHGGNNNQGQGDQHNWTGGNNFQNQGAGNNQSQGGNNMQGPGRNTGDGHRPAYGFGPNGPITTPPPPAPVPGKPVITGGPQGGVHTQSGGNNQNERGGDGHHGDRGGDNPRDKGKPQIP
jgi:hypothetical protein